MWDTVYISVVFGLTGYKKKLYFKLISSVYSKKTHPIYTGTSNNITMVAGTNLLKFLLHLQIKIIHLETIQKLELLIRIKKVNW